MLLAIAFLLLSIALGIGLVERLKFFDSLMENLAFGAPVGIAISSFVVLGYYVLQRGFTDTVFYASLATFVLIIAFLYKDRSALRQAARMCAKLSQLPRSVSYATLAIFTVIAFVLVTSLYMSDGSLNCLGPAICSDLLYHIGVGNSIIYGGFPPAYPFTISALNVFPFINDFYTSLLMRYGLGLVPATLIPDLLLFFAAVVATAELAYVILKSKIASVAALLIFWFGSDFMMGFILYPLASAVPGFHSNLPPLSNFLSGYGIAASGTGAVLATANFIISGWTSILYQNLLQQRGFDLALPLGVFLIYFAYLLVFSKKRFTRPQMLLIGIVVGLMPLIHPITLVALVFFGIYVAIALLADRRRRRELANIITCVAIPAAILIIPQLLYMLAQPALANRYHFVFANYYFPYGASLSALLTNLLNVQSFWTDMVGIPLFLAVAGCLVAGKKVRSFALPFAAIWLMLTLFSFELDGSDSNKFFIYVFLMLCILSGYVFIELSKRGIAGKVLIAVLVLANIANFPAVYSYWAASPIQWLNSAELNASQFALHNTSKSSIFAVSDYDSLIEPIASLGARQSVISFYPYVQIDEYTYPLPQLITYNNQIFAGDCQLIRQLNVSYLYLYSANPNATSSLDNSNFSQVFMQYDSQKGVNLYIYKTLC